MTTNLRHNSMIMRHVTFSAVGKYTPKSRNKGIGVPDGSAETSKPELEIK